MYNSLPVTIIGFITLFLLALRFLNFLYIYFKPSSLYLYQKPGAWALVTGASNGIGLGFARALSAKGFNVILHGRNESKLQRIIADLQRIYPKTLYRTVIADASNSHGMNPSIEAIVSSLHDLPGPLTVLINNVGGDANLPRFFLPLREYTSTDVDGMFNLNARFTTQLTRALLPTLSANNQRGLVINVSSLVGVIAIPYLSIYAGTKAYLYTWSTSLSRELAIENIPIEVLSLVVGRVTDTGTLNEPSSIFIPSNDTVARATLGRVGCGSVVVAPYWGHGIEWEFMGALPLWLQGLFTSAAAAQGREDETKRIKRSKSNQNFRVRSREY